ncbi:hypothetical protein EV401DRAFT_1990681 [Pisolithus croceorrhizus]|nr:hypothetical protein EV401DRAFT_1990681 [Pisolithus croceorrhizus]
MMADTGVKVGLYSKRGDGGTCDLFFWPSLYFTFCFLSSSPPLFFTFHCFRGLGGTLMLVASSLFVGTATLYRFFSSS